MTGRILPQSDRFELLALGKILEAWASTDVDVQSVEKGDQGPFTFDWLAHTSGLCIGIEVVRAEDKDQLDHMEEGLAAGEQIVAGSAEMPWTSVANAVDRKLERATRDGGYLDQIADLDCSGLQLHLAVTSFAQELSWTPDLLWPELERGLEVFDAVWLVHRDLVDVREQGKV